MADRRSTDESVAIAGKVGPPATRCTGCSSCRDCCRGVMGAAAGTALALALIHIDNVEFSMGTLAVTCMSVIICT